MAGLMLRNIHKQYAKQTIVHDLNLDIDPGAFIALLGPSGCGKTTTLRMLAGLENPDCGIISLNQKLLFDSTRQTNIPAEKRNMGMVFQSYALWPHMSVADNVGYPIKLKGIKGAEYQKRVSEALETVQLADKASYSPLKLSGGQRQRVALARCLIAEPSVILLDEPLSNLDRHLRTSMEMTFRQFHRRTGATFVYVTHDQAEAMALADKIAVLDKGKIVQWATPDTIYQQPQNQWLAQFIGNGCIVYTSVNYCHQQLNTAQLQSIFASSTKGSYPIVIRPQHVHIIERNGIKARVIDSIFKGERYEITLSFFDEQVLLAYHPLPLLPNCIVDLHITQAWGVAL